MFKLLWLWQALKTFSNQETGKTPSKYIPGIMQYLKASSVNPHKTFILWHENLRASLMGRVESCMSTEPMFSCSDA